MARNGKKQTPKTGSNQYDQSAVQAYVARIETLMADKASIMGTALQECQQVNKDIKTIVDEAKATHGIAKKALRSVVKARALERKADAIRADLEGDDQDAYDMIRHALGDLAELPLGQAALQRASDQPAA